MLLILSLTLLFHCGSDNESNPQLPADLQIEITNTQDGSGQVAVSATAVNASYYDIYFGDADPELPTKSFSGAVVHNYAASGNYHITIEAHASEQLFISDVRDVAVTVSEDNGPDIPTEGYITPMSYDGMTLVWQDEFNGATLNTDDWDFNIGTGGDGWGNHELEYYTNKNVSMKDGCLVITAKKENMEGQSYTSSRILTEGRKSFQYGRVDIRAALPKGQGIWPALWMLGSDISSVGWPACGEIDIMEMIGGAGRENTVHGTGHWDKNGQHDSYGSSYTLQSGSFQDDFHVFSVTWNADSITWYVDDVEFTNVNITPADLSEFRKPFFFIFNVAVGGDWPGNPDANSTFPQRMAVDYVRVFQQE